MEKNPDRNLLEEFKRIERLHGRLDKPKEPGQRTELTPEIVRRNMRKYFQYLYDHDRYATINGLALHSGFNTRKHMIEFRSKPGFGDLIEAAMTLIEYTYELRLKMPDVKQTGIIFALKNMGWEDKQVIEESRAEDSELAKQLDALPDKKLKAIQKLLKD